MFSKRFSRFAVVAMGAMALVLLLVAAASARPAKTSATTLTIWTDKDRHAAVNQVAGAWAQSKGITLNIVEKQFGDIRTNLSTVAAADAPDVVVGAHDWTGELAASGLLLPLNPSAAVKKNIAPYALDAFSYGTAVKRLYGAPVAIENIGLFVNTKLAKVPTSWAQLEKYALAYKKKTHAAVGIAVQQGANGDAYHMYPFFSGLCGYVFGKNSAGNLDPSNIGLNNKKFLANAPLIDKWNKEGLISSKVADADAKNLWATKKVAYWVTGPWNVDLARQTAAGNTLKIIQIPAIKCASTPFLGVQGFMVTKYAASHGVESAAKDLVGNYMLGTAAQSALAAGNGRYPANVLAGK